MSGIDAVAYRVHGEVGVATVHNPPLNLLSLDVRRGLLAALERGLADDAVKALVITGGGASFVAGADIKDFGKPYAAPSLYTIIDAILASSKPVVAAIHGHALGGGLELALACQWRIASPLAVIGQPEIKLGLMPGGGGTQWWTRLAGPEVALQVCTSGEPVTGAHAHAVGVIDRLAGADLVAAALAFAGEIVDGRCPARDCRTASDKIARVDPALFDHWRARHRDAWQELLAPWKIVDCIEAACRLPFEQGYALEREAFQQCEHSAQSRALIEQFFAARAARQAPGREAGK